MTVLHAAFCITVVTVVTVVLYRIWLYSINSAYRMGVSDERAKHL